MLRFGTAGVRGPVSTELSPEAVVRLGRAIAAEGSDFAVARDGRETGAVLLEAAVAGLASGGATVERLGVIPTPALAFASCGRHGVMITASHNPPEDNGVKLFANGNAVARSVEQRIEERLSSGVGPVHWNAWAESRRGRILPRYKRAVERYLAPIGASPTELSVVVDAGTGTASLVAPAILRQLGATVRTINGTIDGTFPARQSKPTPDSISTLRAFVSDGPADLGLAFDGDADRIVVVASNGSVVHEDTIVAILAEQYVRDARCADPLVVTTPNASDRIDDRVESAGGRVIRTPLGDLSEGIDRATANGDEQSRVVFAAEPWKHLHPNFGPWIDGILSAGMLTKLFADVGLAERRRPIRELPYLKGSIPCREGLKATVMDELQSILPETYPQARVDIGDGIRLNLSKDGWVLVRSSGTEPKIRVYVEADRAEGLLSEVEAVVRKVVESQSSERLPE